MRYLLLLHASESELRERPPAWREEVVAFLGRFEDELLAHSELEWSEALDTDVNAYVVGPGGDARQGWFNDGATPLRRIWAVRVPTEERVREIAGLLAGELDTWVEVRECLPGAQRP